MNDCGPENGQSTGKQCRVLILGGGFGGIYTALELQKVLRRRKDITVTLLSRDNFFLFTPMLHEVATSDLEINTIISPLHKLLTRVATFVGNIEAIDLTAKSVRVSHGFDGHCHDLPFEHLVLALGASTNFFGLPGVEANALALRTINDAVALRSRLISFLEEANSECAVGERKPLLTFVVAGGGFAGVETIGGINDFVRDAVRFYPALSEVDVRMVLVTPDELILAELGPELGACAQRELASIFVAIIPDRPGQQLRQALQQRLEGTGADPKPLYTLNVNYWIAGEGLAVQPDTSTTRIRLFGNANWTLIGRDPSQTVVTTGHARAEDAVNVINTQYFSADLQTEASDRYLAEALADQITTRLAIFFRNKAGAGG